METGFYLIAYNQQIVSPALINLDDARKMAKLPFYDHFGVTICHIAVIGEYTITENPPADAWFLLVDANTYQFAGIRRKKYSPHMLDYGKRKDYSAWKVMVYEV